MTADDWVKLIGAGAAATVMVLGAIGALWAKIHAYSVAVDGRMSELLSATRSAATAEGKATGHAEEKAGQ
jgi:hypothetical protein